MSFVPPFQEEDNLADPAWFNLTPQPKRNKIFSSQPRIKQPQEVIDQVERLGQKVAYITQRVEVQPDSSTELVLNEVIKCKELQISDKNRLLSKNRDTIRELEQQLFKKGQDILDLNAHLYFIQQYGHSIPFRLPQE